MTYVGYYQKTLVHFIRRPNLALSLKRTTSKLQSKDLYSFFDNLVPTRSLQVNHFSFSALHSTYQCRKRKCFTCKYILHGQKTLLGKNGKIYLLSIIVIQMLLFVAFCAHVVYYKLGVPSRPLGAGLRSTIGSYTLNYRLLPIYGGECTKFLAKAENYSQISQILGICSECMAAVNPYLFHRQRTKIEVRADVASRTSW